MLSVRDMLLRIRDEHDDIRRRHDYDVTPPEYRHVTHVYADYDATDTDDTFNITKTAMPILMIRYDGERDNEQLNVFRLSMAFEVSVAALRRFQRHQY